MNSAQTGFTLLELLVTIAILAILINVASPGMQRLSEHTQATATRSNIERAFATARYTAVTERTLVTICPLNQNNQCVNDWSLPTAIFRDPDSSLELTSQTQLIRLSSLAAHGDIKPSNSSHGPRRYFQYRPDGGVRGTIGNLTWCPASKSAELLVQARVNFGGRLTWSRDTNNNGIAEGSSGQDLSC
ncbi:hypothetical protein MRBBS_0732 [Marinobacter sp. BSs20148]|nr:hypothetical protein MRBBS_0732 [Marinobacter sp. BSs20148]